MNLSFPLQTCAYMYIPLLKFLLKNVRWHTHLPSLWYIIHLLTVFFKQFLNILIKTKTMFVIKISVCIFNESKLKSMIYFVCVYVCLKVFII